MIVVKIFDSRATLEEIVYMLQIRESRRGEGGTCATRFMYAYVIIWRRGWFEWLLRCSVLERGTLTKEQYLPDIGGNEAGYF